jgi:hypothetical protein
MKMAKTTPKELTIEITIPDESIFDMIENLDVKPSQAKVNKLKKLFKEVIEDHYEDFEELLMEKLEELANEEWGE